MTYNEKWHAMVNDMQWRITDNEDNDGEWKIMEIMMANQR